MSKILGHLFRMWRTQNKLTLRDCEKAFGLSNAFLSQFERGLTDISLDNAAILFFAMSESNTDKQAGAK